MTCLPGFTVPMVDDVADLPTDGSIPLAVFKPALGLSPSSSTNAYWSGGTQRNGIKQLLLVWHGIPVNTSDVTVGWRVYANSSTTQMATPTTVDIPAGWAPAKFVYAEQYSSDPPANTCQGGQWTA